LGQCQPGHLPERIRRLLMQTARGFKEYLSSFPSTTQTGQAISSLSTVSISSSEGTSKKGVGCVGWGDVEGERADWGIVRTDIELVTFGGNDLLGIRNVFWISAPAFGHAECCCRGGREKRARERVLGVEGRAVSDAESGEEVGGDEGLRNALVSMQPLNQNPHL
jgi:hypothetical protein